MLFCYNFIFLAVMQLFNVTFQSGGISQIASTTTEAYDNLSAALSNTLGTNTEISKFVKWNYLQKKKREKKTKSKLFFLLLQHKISVNKVFFSKVRYEKLFYEVSKIQVFIITYYSYSSKCLFLLWKSLRSYCNMCRCERNTWYFPMLLSKWIQHVCQYFRNFRNYS